MSRFHFLVRATLHLARSRTWQKTSVNRKWGAPECGARYIALKESAVMCCTIWIAPLSRFCVSVNARCIWCAPEVAAAQLDNLERSKRLLCPAQCEHNIKCGARHFYLARARLRPQEINLLLIIAARIQFWPPHRNFLWPSSIKKILTYPPASG